MQGWVPHHCLLQLMRTPEFAKAVCLEWVPGLLSISNEQRGQHAGLVGEGLVSTSLALPRTSHLLQATPPQASQPILW